jgi:hypothetical protein
MDKRVDDTLRQPSLVERLAQNPVGGFLPWIIF